MLVLSKLAKRASSLVDQAATAWLSRLGAGEAIRQHELAILRRLSLLSGCGLVTVPVALSLVASPAVALPAGFGAVLAGFLFSAVGSIALSRHGMMIAAAGTPSADDIFLETCPGLILIFDPQGQVKTTGGRDCDDYLRWMEDPGGKGFFDQLHVHDRLLFLQALDRLRQGETKAEVDLRVEKAALGGDGGRHAWLRLDLTGRFDPLSNLLDVVGQARDISVETGLRDEAERFAGEAQSANEAKSRFLAAVSHELRTPLNAILGFSDVLLGEYFGRFENERQREYVGLIRESGGHLLAVVNTMLDMCKIEAGRYELTMEPFDIVAPIRSCESMLGLQAKSKGLTLTSRVQKGMSEIVADRRAVQQILINLVGNAVKFTEAGGVVTIDAGLRDGILVLSVSDTGIGIPENRLEKLGQPFTQVEDNYARRYEGTGLGLSLVKGLVTLHGGDFAMASREREGTVVTISLPADGSGIATGAAGSATEQVVFPPALKTTIPMIDREREEGPHDGIAQAKIA